METERKRYDGIEKDIFSDVYLLFTRNIEGDGSPVFWEKAVNEARQITKKYHNHPLCINMVVNVMTQLELIKYNKTIGGKSLEEWNQLKESIREAKKVTS